MIDTPRLVGWLRGVAPGPMLVAVGGLHGNEPDGVTALHAVASGLSELDPGAGRLRGDVVLLAGNLAALAADRRYLVRDLNRDWSRQRFGALDALREGAGLEFEDREQLELSQALETARAAARCPIFVADLHTTSADGIPFVTTTSSADDREFALLLPLPLVLGLLEAVGRTLTSYLKERGCTVLAVEGGRRGTPGSAENLQAALWLLLAGTGIVAAEALPSLPAQRLRLEAARAGFPHTIEVRHRHAVRAEDRFQMEPKFANLQRVVRGQLLARDRSGEIRAGEDGFLVLPVYQQQGDDGFFLGSARDAE